MDLDEGYLTLTWNEPVNSMVSFTGVTILSNAANTTSFTLTGGNVTVISDNTLQLMISNDDLNDIFADGELATSSDNTFIYLAQSGAHGHLPQPE